MEHLTPERWAQVEVILEKAIILSPSERTAFLNDACADTPMLRTEVEALLAADVEGGLFLEEAADDYRALLSEFWREQTQTEAELIGKRLGPYQIVQEIGRGGMGAVYLAERADGAFEKQVALKVVKRGMDTDVVLRRFLAERQILARLRHDNIARLLDGGVTDDGQPYFVIEHIDGVPLTEYCDAHCLGIEARLRLFQQVCRAVHYAHQNLVVHRDLKPSNILVQRDRLVKLLDFGIAKVLADEDTPEQAALTRTGMPVLTPEYAAPEQVRGGAITTATDVYALGVILYELLTGHRPYQFTSRSAAEVERVICKVEPEAPSTAVTQTLARRDGATGAVTPEQVSLARSTQADRLCRRLRGDLDTIVMKALRKEPERRYASAEAFLEDIKRHLARLPVNAQPDTMSYRLRKFVGRHRVGVSAAAVLVMLLLMVAVLLVQRAWQTEQIRKEAQKLETVQKFLVGVFEVSDPWKENDGGDLTARELLNRSAERVEELREEPEVQADMLYVLGVVYRQLGMYDEAQPLSELSLALRQELFGEKHLDVASSLIDLARLREERGNPDEAKQLLHRALAIRRQLLGEAHPETAQAMNELGWLLTRNGIYDEAEPLFRKALAIRRQLLGEAHPETAQAMNNLGWLLTRTGAYDEAEQLLREALAIRRQLLDEEHPAVAVTMSNLGALLRYTGAYDEAEQLIRGALTMHRKRLGEEHPLVATTMFNLGLLLQYTGAYDEAEQLHREALRIRKKFLGDENRSVVLILISIAKLMRVKGAYDEAESFLREALRILKILSDEDEPDLAVTLNDLAMVLHDKGDYEAAESFYREALAMQTKLRGEEHLHVAIGLDNLATVLSDQGEYEEAEPLFQASIAMRKKLFGEEHSRVAISQRNLARLLHDRGAYDEAEQLYRKTLTIFRNTLPEGHRRIADALVGWGWLLIDQRRPLEAKPLLQEALESYRAAFGDDDWHTAEAKTALGACLTALERYSEAEPLLQEGYSVLKDKRGEHHKEVLKAVQGLIDLYTAWGKPEQAAAYQAAASEGKTR